MKSTRSWIRGSIFYLQLLFLLHLCLLVNSQVRPAVAACDMYKSWWPSRRKEFEPERNNKESGRFPQIVALGYLEGPDDELVINGTKYICSGTLISEKHVLTAAHCVSNIQGLVPVEVAVLGWVTDFAKIQEKRVKHVPILKIVKHPEYRNGLNYHNIAVIELERPIFFEDGVRPACLMTKPLPSSTEGQNISLTMIGWRTFDSEGKKFKKLRKAEFLELVERNKCSMSYRHIEAQIPNEFDEGMFCVTDPDIESRFDTCEGDSRGPLFLNWEIFPKVVGVSSFSQDCGTNTPDVYASVYEYLDWIEAQVWPGGVVPKTVGCWVLETKPKLMDYMKNLCITFPSDTPCLCLCVNHLI